MTERKKTIARRPSATYRDGKQPKLRAWGQLRVTKDRLKKLKALAEERELSSAEVAEQIFQGHELGVVV